MSRDTRLGETRDWADCVCTACGRPYPQREHYERKCIACFKEDKGYSFLWGDSAFVWAQEKLHEAREKLKTLEKPKPEARTTAADLDAPADLLRDLIFLCHPDKHDGSPRATAATQELLAMREKLRGKGKKRRR